MAAFIVKNVTKRFVYVGLLTMMLVNSSFSNPSFALVIAKNVGSIIDLQLVPICNW
jgi:hypothetical protein